MYARSIRLIGRSKKIVQVIGQSTQMSTRIKHRLQNQLRLGGSPAHFCTVLHRTVAQHRSGNVRAVTIWITGVSRSSEWVESKHAPSKRRMNIVRNTLVEPGVSDGDNLPGSLKRSARLQVIGTHDLSRNIVGELWGKIRLDASHFVDSGEIFEAAPLNAQADLVPPHSSSFRGQSRGLGYFFPDGLTLHSFVQDNVHRNCVLRESIRRSRCQKVLVRRGWIWTQGSRNLEALQVDVCPRDKRKRTNAVEICRRIMANISVFRYVFENCRTQLGQLGFLSLGQRGFGLDQNEIGR